MSLLDEEVRTYATNRTKLLGTSKDKFVLIKKAEVIDVFESLQDALKEGYSRFGNEPFLVKQVLEVEVPQNYTSFQIGT